MNPTDLTPFTSLAGSLKRLVRNAMQPMLWLLGITLITSFSAMVILRDDPVIRYSLLVIVAGCVVVALYSYVHLLRRRPEMLQSEDYQLQRQAMGLVQERGGPINVDPVSLHDLIAPRVRQLSAGETRRDALPPGETSDET